MFIYRTLDLINVTGDKRTGVDQVGCAERWECVQDDTEDFQRAGHGIINLVFVCVGGFVAHSFASRLACEERNRSPQGEET